MCRFCGGILFLLGRLGNLVHLRCRGCGLDQYHEHDELDDYIEQEAEEVLV